MNGLVFAIAIGPTVIDLHYMWCSVKCNCLFPQATGEKKMNAGKASSWTLARLTTQRQCCYCLIVGLFIYVTVFVLRHNRPEPVNKLRSYSAKCTDIDYRLAHAKWGPSLVISLPMSSLFTCHHAHLHFYCQAYSIFKFMQPYQEHRPSSSISQP